MNRLQSELQRLYRPGQFAVLETARPADWQALSKVWRGVQADLALPAPAIAVNGIDGFQLWFSLAQTVPPAQALAFLDALRRRYLSDVASGGVSMSCTVDAAPPLQARIDQWSAFVAPDLAPVFADEPWLDTPPNPDGQADLLARLSSITSADFQAALEHCGANAMPACAPLISAAVSAQKRPGSASADLDPRRFLLDVLNDESVALGLRIDAAKALLPGFISHPQG